MTNTDDRPSPHELLRAYYPLQGAVAPLAEILRVHPTVAEAVIELAMVMGIHAAERVFGDDQRRALLLAEMSYGQTPKQRHVFINGMGE